jgi:hypothetical protein
VRVEPPLARWCFRCFEWIAAGSRAKYCSAACRQAARKLGASGPPARVEPAQPYPGLRIPPAAADLDPRPSLAAAPSRATG